ncbi:MAG: SdrD B-like domain-containing protein [Planctomycetota bacterium]
MIWNPKRRERRRQAKVKRVDRRHHRAERLEARQLLAADPIHLGVVYLETDYLETDLDVGSDSRGDRFIVSFTGGAPNTQLSELRIRTDKDGDGISVGDPIYDTEVGGRGKNGAHGFQLIRVLSEHGEAIDANAEVSDGGQELVLRLSNFRAGDRLEFTIDVDEVLRNSSDLEIFNDRLDVITSGQEFQDSILEATFNAPRFESAQADAVFLNDFGDPASTYGIDVPADESSDIDSRPNRSAAAVVSAQQIPKPIEISGNVWIDNDLDAIREPGEATLSDVEVGLWRLGEDGAYRDTGFRAITDTDGRYEFPKSLGLLPGTYRLVQEQPDGLISVAAVPGTVSSTLSQTDTGIVSSTNEITDIEIPLGDSHASDYDFAETQPASLSGRVFVDANANGQRDNDEAGIPGVQMELIPIDTIASQSRLVVTTDSEGRYVFSDLVPGRYRVIQSEQPGEYVDGSDSPGTVDGLTVGAAENPGDRINNIALNGNDAGVDYDFGEIPLGSITGSVYLAAPGVDCRDVRNHNDGLPLADVALSLIDQNGQLISTTTTDALGQYTFEDLTPGNYRIVQQTPSELLDGSSHPGLIGDVRVGTSVGGSIIADVTLAGAVVAEQYDFCEAAPASIQGVVYHDRNDNNLQDDGEEPIENVVVQLIDENGQPVTSVRTDPDGRYRFDGLPAGTYTIVQSQPNGWLDGRDNTGSVDGRVIGNAFNDRFQEIELRQGQAGTNYNFGERLPGSIQGRVHADLDNDCVVDPDEQALGGITLRLFNDAGSEIARTVTGSDGTYSFTNLPPGSYTLVQDQPTDYFDGGVKPGSAGGTVTESNRIEQIVIGSGQAVVAYDFCEVPPAAIEGMVWQEPVLNGQFESTDAALPGVEIELQDANGHVIAVTRSDADGKYRFEDLPPGEYAIREHQPLDFFHGSQLIGESGGRIAGQDWITGIQLQPGTIAGGYHFIEIPPATISGYVFQDGEPLVAAETPSVDELRRLRDGVRTSDDTPLPGITLQLRDVDGTPVEASKILGDLSGNPLTAITDANGFYEFARLYPGTYHVYQAHPEEYVDGIDTEGTSGGQAINGDEVLTTDQSDLLEQLRSSDATDPGKDAILNIAVVGGDESQNNNFSEIVVQDPPPPPPPPPMDPPPLDPPDPDEVPPTPPVEFADFTGEDPIAPLRAPLIPTNKIRSVGFNSPVKPASIMEITDEWAVTWHLSVINGGYPRGTLGEGVMRPVSTRAVGLAWPMGMHSNGRWIIARDGQTPEDSAISLGDVDATALAGDFNGDGSDEAVIFVAGQWFVDINGNGRWDSSDLWIQLGTELDRPVVGDWDGDGKDDVGIFGRQWQYDPERIPRDPGLPDPANTRRRQMEDPSTPLTAAEKEAQRNTDPPRLLRRNEQGELRADAVDHVFKYGEQADKPVVGDWNGDGIDQVAVFNAGRWLLDEDGDGRRSDMDSPVSFGEAGDLPIAGDFNGDGIDEIGVVRGQWWIIDTDGDRRLTGNDRAIQVPPGSGDNQPVVADWDGDGKDEPGYYQSRDSQARKNVQGGNY